MAVYDVDALVADSALVAELKGSLAGGLAPLLRDAKIKLTSKCNLRCTMCDYWRTVTEETLDTAGWQRVLGELRQLGCQKVHLSGGEVFLRRDVLDIVEHGLGLGLRMNLTTNGTLVRKEAARRLVKMGTHSVSVSLDGPTARIHDVIRGREGAFATTVRCIERLTSLAARYRRRTKVRVNFVMMRDNYRRAADMVDLAASLGAVDVCPMPVDETGEGRRRLSSAHIERYNRDVAPAVHTARERAGFPLIPSRIYPFGITERDVRHARKGLYARGYFDERPCLVPWLHTFIAWNGQVYLCCMTTERMEPLGDVRRESVRDIVEGARYRAVREQFLAGALRPQCPRCDLYPRENRVLAAATGARITRPSMARRLPLLS